MWAVSITFIRKPLEPVRELPKCERHDPRGWTVLTPVLCTQRGRRRAGAALTPPEGPVTSSLGSCRASVDAC